MFDISLVRVSPLESTVGKFNLIISAPARIARIIRCSLPAFLNSIDGNIVVEVKVLCNGVRELRPTSCVSCDFFTVSNIIPLTIASSSAEDSLGSSDSSTLGYGYDSEDNYNILFDTDCGRSCDLSNKCNCFDLLSASYNRRPVRPVRPRRQEGVVVIRAFDPCVAKLLSFNPISYISDDRGTLRITLIFDRCGSADPCLCNANRCCNFNNCGFGNCGGGFWGFEWFIILIILFVFGGFGCGFW